jgi:predicted ATPase/class 3 adenylate cyclase
MSGERQQLEGTIAGLEAQRALLGDALVDAALVPLRAKLASLAAPADEPFQTLKQVTILFLDIVGSTTLSQHLDPEQTSDVMDGALAQFATVLQRHGGKVLKYAGDSVLAVFGADEAREDDPERAVRAGLALLDAGREQGAQVHRQHGHDGFNVRVGVHTGGVLLGGGVDAEGSIRGQAVNVAARMEQTAPAGTLRISHGTYRHVRGVFDVEPQPPLAVRGMEEPLATYLVQRAKPRAFRVATRGIEGVETRMIGRDAELEQLQAAFKRLYADAKLAVVSVVAEAGVGKSRLLYEFDNWIETRPERFAIFQGRAHPQTVSQPYGLLRDILAWRLQIADSDSMDAAKDKIEREIIPLFETDDGIDMAQAHAHLLGHLIGLNFGESRHIKGIQGDGKQIRNRGFHAAAQMFRRIAARDGEPIVLLLEDLHWADDGSLDFLNYITQVNRDVPMLMLGLTRPTLFERRSGWGGIEGIHERVELNPLDKGSSRLLADELLKKLPKVPAALRDLITSGAEGNPFYMEELVKMLVDEGAIETGADRWSVNPARLVGTHVPQTLTGVLQARLDGLKPAEKLALQQASVIGVVFWDNALSAIDALAMDALPALMRRELIVPRQDAGLDGVREYAFKHQILHHVTYDTVLKRTRRDCHAKVATWMTGLTGARANDFLGATAEHFAKAGDNTNACEFFTRAAERAAARYAHEAAMGYVASAVALIGEDAHPDDLLVRWRLLDVRERTLDLLGRRSEQRADIDALQQLADAMDDDRRRGEVAWRWSDFALRTADFRALESAARRTMVLAEHSGDGVLGLRAQHRLATALVHLGDFEASRAIAQSGLESARAQGLRQVEAIFLNALSMTVAQGDLMAILEMDQQQLAIDRELGNRRSEATTLGNLGWTWLTLGEHAEAKRHLEGALKLIHAVGDRNAESYPLISLSQLALRQNDAALALTHAQSALDIAIAVQDRGQEALALLVIGQANAALGRHAKAITVFERAHAAAQAIDSDKKYDAAVGLAQVALEQRDVARAMRAIEGPLAHLAGGGILEGTEQPHLIQLIIHRVLAHAGDPRASDMLASAHAALQSVAAMITDPMLRQSYLDNIPEHREIVAAWAAQQEATAGRQ